MSKDLYSSLAAIPEDREEILTELEELLQVTPESSNRGRMDHLLTKLAQVSGSGGIPVSEEVADAFKLYRTGNNVADMYYMRAFYGTVTPETLAHTANSSAIVGVGTDDHGYVIALYESNGRLHRDAYGNYNGLGLGVYASDVAITDKHTPMIGLPTMDRSRGGDQCVGSYYYDVTAGTIEYTTYPAYGKIADASPVVFPPTALDSAITNSEYVGVIPFSVSARWMCILVHAGEGAAYQYLWHDTTGSPYSGSSPNYNMDEDGLLEVHHSSTPSNSGSVALIHAVGSQIQRIIVPDSTGNALEAHTVNMGMAANLEPDLADIGVVDSNTAIGLFIRKEYWEKGEDELALTLGVITLDSGSMTGTHFKRSELDPEFKYGIPFLYSFNRNSLEVLLAFPRLDGSGIDMYDVSNPATLDMDTVNLAYPLSSVVRETLLACTDHVLRCVDSPAGGNIGVFGAMGSGGGGSRKLLAVDVLYGNSAFDYVKDLSVGGYDPVEYATNANYLTTVDVDNGVEAHHAVLNGQSPNDRLVGGSVNGVLVVDDRPVDLDINADEGTQVLYLRPKNLRQAGRTYYNTQSAAFSTPILESDPVTGATTAGKVLGYIGLSSKHPKYSGAALCTKTVDGWKVKNLL